MSSLHKALKEKVSRNLKLSLLGLATLNCTEKIR